MRLNPLIGRIMSLSLLLLLSGMMTACASTRVQEAQIAADAQTTTAQTEANAKIAVANADSQARIGVAQAQADATRYASAQEAEATKYTAKEQTAQAGIYASIAPLIMGMLVVAVLAGIVLWYRGKAHLIRVTNEVLLLSPPLPAPSRQLPSRPQPQVSLPTWIPEPVRVMAVERGADNAKQSADGEWLLYRHGHLLLTMRPKQLTDKQRSDAWS